MGQDISAATRTVLVAMTDRDERTRLATLLATDCRLAPLQAADSRQTDQLMLAPAPRVDALLLDAAMDGQDGAAHCAALRRRGVVVPILLIGPGSVAAVVRGLDAGANDCIARPLRLAETAARVRAQLRLHDESDDAVLTIGPYRFRPAQRALHDQATGQRILLTEKEAGVLKHLYRARGAPVARRILLHEVWGYSPAVTTHTVETHVYRLRRKIEPQPGQHALLVNAEGGYRLNLAWQPPAPPPRSAFAPPTL